MKNFRPTEAALRRGEAAAWGPAPSAFPRIRRWIPYRNAAGSQLGFIDAQLPSGMITIGLKLMRGPAGNFWIAMPSQKQLDHDGRPRLDSDGKPQWTRVIEFIDKATRNRFGAIIIAALRNAHPEAFDDVDAP